jgi:hypothetical protein
MEVSSAVALVSRGLAPFWSVPEHRSSSIPSPSCAQA